MNLNQDQKIVRKPYIGPRGIDFKIKEPASAKSYGRNYQNCSRSSRKVSGLSEIEEGVNSWLCWRQRQKLDHKVAKSCPTLLIPWFVGLWVW